MNYFIRQHLYSFSGMEEKTVDYKACFNAVSIFCKGTQARRTLRDLNTKKRKEIFPALCLLKVMCNGEFPQISTISINFESGNSENRILQLHRSVSQITETAMVRTLFGIQSISLRFHRGCHIWPSFIKPLIGLKA